MKTILCLLLLTMPALSETCTLDNYASSWMKTGTKFSCTAPSGVHTGVLVTRPARRFFRRGQLYFKFDQPVVVTAKNEGVFKPNRGQQIVGLLVSGGSGIAAKDIFDGVATSFFKPWFMIPITFTAVAVFEKGGDVNLQPGFQIPIEPAREGTDRPNPE